MVSSSEYKKTHSVEDCLKESKKILAKYPDRVPVIVEKVPNSDVPDIDRAKFLVPSDLTYGQFLYTIRSRLKLSPEKAMYIMINNTMQPSNTLMSELYMKHQERGFLFCQYAAETTFG